MPHKCHSHNHCHNDYHNNCEVKCRPLMPFVKGEYHVFPEAKNRGNEWSTIQAAINAALIDGITPASGKKAAIIIHGSDTHYTGDPINNDINVPGNMHLIGTGTEGTPSFPQIKATVKFSNTGVALPPDYTGFVAGLLWNHSNISFIQPSADKPAIILEALDFTSVYLLPYFKDCQIVSGEFAATVPVVEIYDFTIGYFESCFAISVNPNGLITCYENASIELVYTTIVANVVIRMTGNSPTSIIFVLGGQFYSEANFLGGVDTEIKQIEITGNGVVSVYVSHALIGSSAVGALTSDQAFLKAAPGVTGGTTLGVNNWHFSNNTYVFAPTLGTNYLYNAPSATLGSGGNVIQIGSVSAVSPGTTVIPYALI